MSEDIRVYAKRSNALHRRNQKLVGQIVKYKDGWYKTESAGNGFFWVKQRANLPDSPPVGDAYVHWTHLYFTGLEYEVGKQYTEAELGTH